MAEAIRDCRKTPRVVFAFVFLLASISYQAFGTEADRLEKLPPDQRALARSMIAFTDRMDQKYFDQVADLNGGAIFENRKTATQYSDFDVRVSRGPVVEKAGRMLAVGKKTSPGRGDRILIWGRFYSLDIHPRTPLVGMLHATIVLQFFEDGSGAIGGWLGVLPGTRIEEDLADLRQLTDAHFAKYNKDPELYRRLICKGTEDIVAKWRRQPACSGASFYGPPVFPRDTEKSFNFVAEMFDAFVGVYMAQIEKRANDPYTQKDIAAQDEMRKRWLVDQLFSDPFASKIVPFEVWSFANVPPVIKF